MLKTRYGIELLTKIYLASPFICWQLVIHVSRKIILGTWQMCPYGTNSPPFHNPLCIFSGRYCQVTITMVWPGTPEAWATRYVILVDNILQWRHNEHDGVSNLQPHDCLINRLLRRRSKKTPKPRVTGLCAGNASVTGEFPTQNASNAWNVFISWRHHVIAEKVVSR